MDEVFGPDNSNSNSSLEGLGLGPRGSDYNEAYEKFLSETKCEEIPRYSEEGEFKSAYMRNDSEAKVLVISSFFNLYTNEDNVMIMIGRSMIIQL
jgi:hypothetical protein